MIKYVVWNEPLCLDEGHVYNSLQLAEPKEVIGLWKHTHPEYNYTSDEEALEDFMIVYWAWFIELPEDWMQPNKANNQLTVQ